MLQLNASAARAQAFAGKLREGQHQVRDGLSARIEKIQIEMEVCASGNMPTVKVRSTEDERAGCIGESARAVRNCGRGKQPSIGTGCLPFTGASVVTLRHARDAPEDCAERSAQNVGGFTGGKVERIKRAK